MGGKPCLGWPCRFLILYFLFLAILDTGYNVNINILILIIIINHDSDQRLTLWKWAAICCCCSPGKWAQYQDPPFATDQPEQKNLNIVLLLSSRLIHLIARKNLTKAKQFYYGRVVEIKLKSLDLAGTSLVFCQRVNYCNSLFWEDFANVREVVSSMNSQLKQFDFQESEKQTGKVVKIYVWQKLKRFWKTGILMRWRGRMKNDVVASQSFPKCKI